MKLHLEREYWPLGTNGTITIDDFKICHSIERPWKRNQQGLSCIPEGMYSLEKHFSENHGWCMKIKELGDGSAILLQTAHDAMKELQGNIAIVSRLVGEGKGTQSRIAFEKLKELVFSVLDEGEEVLLEIKSYPDAALNLVQYEQSWMD